MNEQVRVKRERWTDSEDVFIREQLSMQKNRTKSGKIRSAKIFGRYKTKFPNSTHAFKGFAFHTWKLATKRVYRRKIAPALSANNDMSSKVVEAGLIALEAKAHKVLEMVKEMRNLLKQG